VNSERYLRAGWGQAAHSECCFGLSAWHFWIVCHLKPISWSFRMHRTGPWIVLI
jgi:hypothetical protein